METTTQVQVREQIGGRQFRYAARDWELADAGMPVPMTVTKVALPAVRAQPVDRELAAREWARHGVDPCGPVLDVPAGRWARWRQATRREMVRDLALTPTTGELLDPASDPYGAGGALVRLLLPLRTSGQLHAWLGMCVGALVLAGVVQTLAR